MSIEKFAEGIIGEKVDEEILTDVASNPVLPEQEGYQILVSAIDNEPLMWSTISRPNTIWVSIKDGEIVEARVEK